MPCTAPAVDRPDIDHVAPERAALEQWLRYHRQTLQQRIDGAVGE